jgi:N-acetylglutamate synthase-like GNAT family acetyltransferase
MKAPGMKVRTANSRDAAAVHRVVAHYVEQGLLLPRSAEEVREHIDHFLVLVETREGRERVLGCVALEPYGSELAEIRSLAVAPEARGHVHKAGDQLMQAAIATARQRKITRLFAVTHRPDFFVRYGFVTGPRQAVPEKVERDCATCPKQAHCELVAAVLVVCPERDVLPVVDARRKALSVA